MSFIECTKKAYLKRDVILSSIFWKIGQAGIELEYPWEKSGQQRTAQQDDTAGKGKLSFIRRRGKNGLWYCDNGRSLPRAAKTPNNKRKAVRLPSYEEIRNEMYKLFLKLDFFQERDKWKRYYFL